MKTRNRYNQDLLDYITDLILTDLNIMHVKPILEIKWRNKESARVMTVAGKLDVNGYANATTNYKGELIKHKVVIYAGNKSLYSLVRTLSHELRHVWQADCGLKHFVDGVPHWDGKPVEGNNRKDINTTPPERDAIAYSDQWDVSEKTISIYGLGKSKRYRIYKKSS